MRKLSVVFSLLLLLMGCSQRRDPNTVIIGIIRVPNDTVIAIQNKWIEDAYRELGYEVSFRFFDSGVAMNQAFASGSIDIAEMGYTNSIITAVKKLPVELFWIHDVIGSSEALVVRDHEVDEISDLRDKTIATIFASTSHFSLLKALELGGLEAHDVTLLNMSTAEIVAAWDRGDLDASYTWEPTLSKVKESGRVLIDSEAMADLGYITTNVGLVHENFVKNHRELLLTYIECMNLAYELRESFPETVILNATNYLEIDYETAKTQLDGSKWLSMEEQVSEAYLGDSFLDVFYDTAKFWYELEFIDEELSMEEVRKFVNPSYIREVLSRDSN